MQMANLVWKRRLALAVGFFLAHHCAFAGGDATSFSRVEATAETLRHHLATTALAKARAAQAHKLYVLSHRFRFVWTAFDRLNTDFEALHARVQNHTVRDADFGGTLEALARRRQRLRRTLRSVQAELVPGAAARAAAFGRAEGQKAALHLADGARPVAVAGGARHAMDGVHSARKLAQLAALGANSAVMYSIHITHHVSAAFSSVRPIVRSFVRAPLSAYHVETRSPSAHAQCAPHPAPFN